MVEFIVNDGDDNSNIATVLINITEVNDPIDINDPVDPAAINEGNSVSFSGFSITDNDAGDTDNVDDITASIYLTGLDGAVFGSFSHGLAGDVTVAGGSGNGMADAITFTGTKTDVANLLDTLVYTAPDDDTIDDSYTLHVNVTDNGHTGISATVDNTTIDFVVNNVAPASGGDLAISVDEGSSGNIIATADLAFSDVLADTITYRVDSLVSNGTLYINGIAASINDIFSQTDINTNLITYDHDASNTISDSFTFSALDEDGGINVGNLFNITINLVNDEPELNFVNIQQLGNAIVGTSGAQSGYAVSASEDGSIVAIGAINANNARVYQWDGSSWNQMGLTLSGETGGDQFGGSLRWFDISNRCYR
ncbi:MAG: hypothetical protein EP298_00280 [Gammaproteobacteria bacterium]|nr:MAG: hypothetical protein EP298_00280 [Gammaproteobacteria bacterium]